jgi:hypothetical protein
VTATTRFSLDLLVEGQAQPEITVNTALNIVDVVAQLNVIDRNLTAPPGSPAEGALYIIATGGTGAWSGQDGKLAIYFSGWYFIAPKEGFQAWVADEDIVVIYDGSAWVTQLGTGDMVASTYDSDSDGIVDAAEALDDGTHSVSAEDVVDHIAAYNPHGATASATASRLILRDGNGRAKVANPVDAADIATKAYVDGFGGGGGGDMAKATYDTDNNNIVDAAETLDDGTHTISAEDVVDHVADTTNPHNVTHTQVGAEAAGAVATHAALTGTHGVTGSIVGTGGAQVLSQKTLTSVKYAYFDAVYSNGSSDAAKEINFSNGQDQSVSITANTTLTLRAPGAGRFSIDVMIAGAGGYNVALAGYGGLPVLTPGGEGYIPSQNIGDKDTLVVKFTGSEYRVQVVKDWR